MTFSNVKNFLISWGLFPTGIKKSSISKAQFDLLFHHARHIGGAGSHIEFFIPVALVRKGSKFSLPYDSWEDIRKIWRRKLP
jgi:hypothetical protein